MHEHAACCGLGLLQSAAVLHAPGRGIQTQWNTNKTGDWRGAEAQY